MSKADQSWRESYSGLSLRDVEVEIEGEKSPRKFQAYRIWEKPEGKTGFQLSNDGPGRNRWIWFLNTRIVSFTVTPISDIQGE